MEEDRRDTRQPGGPVQELVLVEPGRVREVVGADADKREPILRWAVTVGTRSPCRFVGDQRVLPGAPSRGGALADVFVGEEQRRA